MADLNALAAIQAAALKDFNTKSSTVATTRAAWIASQRAFGVYEGADGAGRRQFPRLTPPAPAPTPPAPAPTPPDLVTAATAHKAAISAVAQSKAVYEAAAKAFGDAVRVATSTV